MDDVENSYILREYFKNFKTGSKELYSLREKINKTDRNLILDNIVNQNNGKNHMILKTKISWVNYEYSVVLSQSVPQSFETVL